MHLILTGSTGLIGAGVLHHMIITSTITKVSVLSRSPVPMAENEPKVDVIIHKDFNHYPPELLEKLKGADGCVWALGVSQNAVSKEKYTEITKDYALEAAKAFSTLKDPFKFVYVSGEGATLTPGRFTATYGIVKGQTEQALLDLSKTTPSLKPYSLRPAIVDPKAHKEILPFIPKSFKNTILTTPFSHILSIPFRQSFYSPTADLGRVLVDLAMSDGKPLQGEEISGEGRTISNVGMRKLAGI